MVLSGWLFDSDKSRISQVRFPLKASFFITERTSPTISGLSPLVGSSKKGYRDSGKGVLQLRSVPLGNRLAPFKRISSPSGSSKRSMHRRSVLLPPPDGPSTTWHSPFFKVKEDEIGFVPAHLLFNGAKKLSGQKRQDQIDHSDDNISRLRIYSL